MNIKHLNLRKQYKVRSIFRILVLCYTIIMMYFVNPHSLSVLDGYNFFRGFSWLHVIWMIAVVSMLLQVIPTKGLFSIGSTKHFKVFFKSTKRIPTKEEFKALFKKGSLNALKMLVIWIALIAVIGILWAKDILAERELLLISVVFYVLDLLFVLYWCPIRAWILKNRCCSTCRIFNWDHMMMFSPLIFIKGFFSISLFAMSIVNFLVWEIRFFLYPERFFEETNALLQCHNCKDKLCGNINHTV